MALAAVTAPEGSTSVEAFPLPAETTDTGLLRVEASGVCGTDVGLVANRALTGPTILGHHVVGRVESVGEAAASRWGVAPGDLVAVQEYLPCHACRWCRAGEFRFCDRVDLRTGGRRFGTTPVDEPPALWGGNAQYLHLPREALVHRLPESMAATRAVWLLPLANAFDWTLEAGRLGPGEAVVVVGPGQHGLACVVAAREAGAGTVVLVGTPGDDERLALGAKIGADHTVAAAPHAVVAEVLDRLGGAGADAVVNTSGAGPELLATLVQLAGRRGRIVEAGLARGHAPSLDMEAITARALAVVGARGRSLQAIDRAIVSLDTGAGPHPLDDLPSREVGLTQLDEVLRPGGTPGGRRAVHTVVRPWSDEAGSTGRADGSRAAHDA